MPSAPELIHTAYARELADAAILYEGMSLADLAHVVVLTEAGVIPREPAGELIAALLEIHPNPPLDFSLDPATGDLYANREAYLSMLTSSAGWLSAGRARREATTIAYRIAVRIRLLALAAALADCASGALDVAEPHRATLFPDYTYLQTAQPTTFGHYLLTFAYPLLRDLDRLRPAFARTNASPAGSGSVNGSRLPSNRERLAELLGFEAIVPHTRDAMWQADGPIEIAALVTSALVTLDRLAEDLQIYSTNEFGLVALADEHTRPSVIMPQKKNPYALAYTRGVAGEAVGTLAAMAAVGKTPSGQLDNRVFAYGDVPRALDKAIGVTRLMAGVLRGLRVNVEHAKERAAAGFSGATDLAEVIMLSTGLDYRAAHRLVGQAVRDAIETGATTLSAEGLDAAAHKTIWQGRGDSESRPSLGLRPEVVANALDPAAIVATRAGPGGAAEPPMAAMIAGCRETVGDHERWRQEAEMRLSASETFLLMTAAGLKMTVAQRAPAETDETREPRSLEELFDDLPQPPHRQRWQFPLE